MSHPVTEALEELIALGVEGPALLAAIRRIEEAAYAERLKTMQEAVDEATRVADARKAKDAARKRKPPASAEIQGTPRNSMDVRGTPRPLPTRTQVVIPSLPHLRSEEVGGGGGETREPAPKPDDWPTGNGPHLAKQLVEAVGSHWLDPDRSPELTLTAGRLAAWRRDGASWEHDVLPVVRALCAKRRSRIGSWKYFDDAVARSIADNRAALSIPEAGQIIQFRATGPPRTIDEKSSASWDYAIRKIAEDEQSEN